MKTNENHSTYPLQIKAVAEDIERLDALADQIHNAAGDTDAELGLDEVVERLDAHIDNARWRLISAVPADIGEIASFSKNLERLIVCEEDPDRIEDALRRLALAANALHQQFQAERYQPAVSAPIA